MPDPSIAHVLKQPFAEQVAFFRGKLGNLVPTQAWDDLWKAQHDRAFMVAGAAKADLLADLYQTVEKSISEGKSIGWFRANFDEIVEKHGWNYRGERNWRTRVIYQTNMSTSYAAGREAQIAAAGFPFKMYKHSDSVMHPRPHHLAWDGLTLPVGHPFWLTHSAPNGWGCKCRIIGIRNEAAARRLGGRWGDQPPADWDRMDAKTGEQIGIDKGWGYAPGRSLRPFDRSGNLPDCLGGDLSFAGGGDCLSPLPGQKTWKDFGRADLRIVPQQQRIAAPVELPMSATREQAVEAMAQALGVSTTKPVRLVDTPAGQVPIVHGYLDHMVDKAGGARERYANFILPTLMDPFEVWATAYADSIRRRYIGLFTGRSDLLVVVRVNKDGSLFWNFMQANSKSLNKTRLGGLLYGK